MLSILIAFPNISDADRIRNLLVKNGYDVSLSTNNAAQVIQFCDKLDGGIVLCGYKLTDMLYHDLYRHLPKEFKIMLLASPKRLYECYESDIVKIAMPLKINELIRAIETVFYEFRKKKKRENKNKERSEEEKKAIYDAKKLLMNNHNMSENEAHRYIQKISMDSGNSMS